MKNFLRLIIIFFSVHSLAIVPDESILRLKIDYEARNAKSSNEIYPFTTDGCSRFPDGFFGKKATWLICCEIHDIAYWAGHGNIEARDQSDKELRECVKEKTNTGKKTGNNIIRGSIMNIEINSAIVPPWSSNTSSIIPPETQIRIRPPTRCKMKISLLMMW